MNAHRTSPAATGTEHHQYLTFRLGEETFALPILSIKEISNIRR